MRSQRLSGWTKLSAKVYKDKYDLPLAEPEQLPESFAAVESVFAREEDGRYRRIDEIHREYAYDADRVAELLQKAGFRDVKVFGDRRCVPPAKNEERIFFAAQKP